MKKSVKCLLSLIIAIIMVCALSLTALAAEPISTPGISVQIGDKLVAFSDAVPEAKNGRTFLPVRACFEALGAQVTYNGDTKIATAVKGDTTVQLGVNGKTITVTSAGSTHTIQMDVASYIKNNRMMVPARFAAQAFGCNVGWDADEQTVIILDVNSLLDGGNAKYTLMDKFLTYSKKYEKNWVISGTFKLSADVSSNGKTVPIVSDGTINAIYDSNAVNMKLDMATDITSLISDIENASEFDNQTMLLLEMMKNLNIEYIFNLNEEIVYLRSPLLSSLTDESPDTWFSVNLKSLLTDSTATPIPFVSVTGNDVSGFRNYVASIINTIPLTDVETASELTRTLSMINTAFSDAAFVHTGDTYTSTKSFNENAISGSFSFSLTLNNDAITGYSMDIKATDNDMDMNIKCSMDANNKMDLSVDVCLPSVIKFTVTAAMQYSQATKPAATAPEAGSTIVPLDPNADA